MMASIALCCNDVCLRSFEPRGRRYLTRGEHAKGLAIRFTEKDNIMKLNRTIQQAGATGYILLWLLGIPIPILLLIFLLRGCT